MDGQASEVRREQSLALIRAGKGREGQGRARMGETIERGARVSWGDEGKVWWTRCCCRWCTGIDGDM